MKRTGWIAIGAAAGIPAAIVVAVPVAIMTGAMMNGADLKAGVIPASTTCGNPAVIQQVSVNTPKVNGYSKAQVANAATIIKVGQEPHGLAVWPQPGRYSLGHTGIVR